jgi:hypothetical protein
MGEVQRVGAAWRRMKKSVAGYNNLRRGDGEVVVVRAKKWLSQK